MATKGDLRQLYRVYDITDPWIQVNAEREPFVLTLKSGLKIQLVIPLGAAVELEEKGYDIKAGYLSKAERDEQPYGASWLSGNRRVRGPSDRPIRGPSDRPL